jgi:hypothetical protein
MWDDLQKALTKYAAVLGRDASPAPSRETSLTEDQTTLEAWRRLSNSAERGDPMTAVRKSTDQEGGR